MSKVIVKQGEEPLFSYDDETGEIEILRSSLSWKDAIVFKDAIARFQKRRDPRPASSGLTQSDFLSNNINLILDHMNKTQWIRRPNWLLRKLGVQWVIRDEVA